MRCCVTGGAGFIGSHLADALCAKGHEVLVIDNLSAGNKKFVPQEATFLEMDVRDPKLVDAFINFGVEVVFHLAAQTMVDMSMKDPKMDADINILGLVNVLEAARAVSAKKIITPSSAAVYGDSLTLPLTEEMTVMPTSFYGLTKYMMEHYLRIYYEQFGLSYTCFRYSNVYGPRQGCGGEGGVISIFLKRVVEGLPLTVFGDGEQTRDFIYVEDVVRANIAALETLDVVGVFNVSTYQALSVNAMIEALKKVSTIDCNVTYMAEREGDIRHSLLSNEKIKNHFLWAPKRTFEEGLAITYAYFKDE